MPQASTLKLPSLDDSRLLRTYAVYRVLLSASLLALALYSLAPNYLGYSNPQLFYNTALGYCFISLITLPLAFRKNRKFRESSIFMMLLLDTASIHLFMHASGGLDGSLGYLLIVTVAVSGILQRTLLSLAIAALASSVLIVVNLTDYSLSKSGDDELIRSGVFGTLLFITAYLFTLLSQRLQSAQEKALEEARQAATLQQLNSLVINKMRTGIIILDSNLNIAQLNERAALLIGDLRDGRLLARADHLSSIPELINYHHAWQTNPRRRLPTFKPSSSAVPLQVSFSHIDDKQNPHTIIFLEDARSLTQHAQQLKNNALGELTSSIAHEVRNPLGAISHAAQLMEESPQLVDEDKELLNIILRHSRRMDKLVRNILQLSRRQLPAIRLVNLSDTCQNCITQLKESQQFSNPVIELNVQPTVGPVPFDENHLQQVLINLLSNALRHSEKRAGQHWAKINIQNDPEMGLITLRIYDRGDGIAPQDCEKVFEPFYTTDPQGTGLGLYISRGLCEANFATLSYVIEKNMIGCFQIIFSDQARQLPESSDDE